MEVTYQLEDSSLFPDLLNSLEQTKQTLGIKEYGITLTTLQDVFMRYVGKARVMKYIMRVYFVVIAELAKKITRNYRITR